MLNPSYKTALITGTYNHSLNVQCQSSQSRLWPLLTPSTATTLIQAITVSHLDYHHGLQLVYLDRSPHHAFSSWICNHTSGDCIHIHTQTRIYVFMYTYVHIFLYSHSTGISLKQNIHSGYNSCLQGAQVSSQSMGEGRLTSPLNGVPCACITYWKISKVTELFLHAPNLGHHSKQCCGDFETCLKVFSQLLTTRRGSEFHTPRR